ncbi:MAG: hypothetical protein CL677_07325 [Bdellovibrionaceae bacterium]|nr:hypothetical protein [Pseudobdellovibrionaceae bacterium]|tara:strand:- start:74320 stop:74772 length:453 start_codon:yes stop_codon:yes gene_type:complete
MRKPLLFLIFLSLCGCSSAATLQDLSIPLATIKRAINSSLPLGVRKVSDNGRTYYSHYYTFSKKKKGVVSATNAPKRFYAEVIINGTTRPYDVKVTVRQEVREKNVNAVLPVYSDRGIHQGQSKAVARRIGRALTQRPKEINIIDDYRVF